MSQSIILVGMPGAGKSTVGVILAKSLGLPFVDTDLLIQQREGALLQEIINQKGVPYFMECEQRHILEESFSGQVVATGGSVVYSAPAVQHLKKFGKVVYLEVSVKELTRRVKNFEARGIVKTDGETLQEILEQRRKLYETYQDITVHCDGLRMEQVVSQIIKQLKDQ